MFTIFVAIWHKFFPVYVDAILSDLNKTVTRLEAAAQHHGVKRALKNDTILKLQDQVDAHTAEASKAIAVASNIKALITPKGN